MRRLALVLTLTWAGPVAAQSFADLVERRDAGDLVGAYALAEGFEDALLADQGRLYVRYHAGDLSAAFEAGLAGLERHPEDLWLLERSARLALDLSAAGHASELAGRLRAATRAAELDAAGQAAWLETADEYERLAQEHLTRLSARDAALGRARTVVWVVAACASALLVLLLLSGRRAARAGLTAS